MVLDITHLKDMQVFFYNNKDRLTVFQMPSYSPDYNPIEILWKKVKKSGIHLKFFKSFEDLTNTAYKLLEDFAMNPKEVLKVFGFYTKRCKP
jgi:transposase